MNSQKLLALSAGLLVAAAAPAAAQAPIGVELTPVVGAMIPATDLAEDVSLKTGVAVGGHLGVVLGERWGLEGTFLYSPSEIEDEQAGVALRGDVNTFQYGANLNLFLPTPSARVTPFLTGGLGAKTYDYDVEGLDGETNFAGNVGAGLKVAATDRLGLRLDVRDYMSNFEVDGGDSELQHDVLLSVGLSWRIR